METDWNSLPLLPLRCVLDHLSLEDALAALSTCRHWRSAILLYEGRKDTLKLNVKNIEQNLFLTRLFKKHTRKLHIYIDSTQKDLQKFMEFILPQYFDTLMLEEIMFIGASYIHQNYNAPIFKLKRIITESLVFKNLHCLKNLALLGCEMDTMKNSNERYTHKSIEYYSRPLSFNSDASPADSVLSRCNMGMLEFSTLRHIIVEYECISTEALETLSHLTMFTQLTLNINNKKQLALDPIDWHHLRTYYAKSLEISLNIIGLPHKRFKEVVHNVLVEGLALTSLKVMFCKTFFTGVIRHVVRYQKTTLRELVWVDGPCDAPELSHRVIKPSRIPEFDMCNINPFILLCWQCVQLRRLVIHGYWVWQYDLLGMVRLRRSLENLEVSSIYTKQGSFCGWSEPREQNMIRVLAEDEERPVDGEYVQRVNQYTEFEWQPTQWCELHPGLRARASPEQRAAYVAREASRPLGVT